MTVVVNATVVRTVPPHSQDTLLVRDLPALPWAVEARSPSGRVLTGMTVRPGDVWTRGNEMKGDAIRVDLSYGRLDLWSGPPLLDSAPGPGTPGDCAP